MAKELRILVVDDEKTIGIFLNKYLSGESHKVEVLESGAEAIELTKREDFELVLCDLIMPEVSGYDVIKALSELNRKPKIGIITGGGEKLKFLEEENMKVDFIIKKPFDFSELAKHINVAFGPDSR